MEKKIYTGITEATLTAARDRVQEELERVTGTKTEVVVALVAEYNELNGILEEHRQREREQAAATASYEQLIAAQNKEFSKLAEVLEKE